MLIQDSPFFEAELKELNRQAAVLVEKALKDLEAHPEQLEDIFRETIETIRYEIFGDGCLGPGTAAATPEPHMERIGKACGKFDEKVFQKSELEIEFVLNSAQRAAKFLGKKEFTLGKHIDEPPGWERLFFKIEESEINEVTQEGGFGLNMTNLKYLGIIEPYFDLFRCKYEYDWDTKQLVVRGRKEFVDAVVTGTNH